MGISAINATQLLTIAGQTDLENSIGSIVELQLQRNLINTDFLESSFRNTLRAEQVSKVGGMATAIYRIGKRVVWGSKYDPDTGAKRKRSGSQYTTYQLNKFLNIKFMVEEYDMDRLQDANPATRAGLIGEWIGSLTTNLIMNKDLIFKQALKTWAIAHYNKSDKMPTVLVVDKSKFATRDDIVKWQQELLNLMTNKLKIVNDTTIGTNLSDYTFIMSYELYNSQLPAFVEYIDNTGAKALATGEWYANSAMGIGFYKDINLQMTYNKDDESKMNDDISYDLSGVDGMISHNSDWAAPDALEVIRQVLEPETGNLQWIGKYLFGLPMSTRMLTTIIMDHEPTADEIAQAKSECVAQGVDQGPMDDLETYRVQLSKYDSLDGGDDNTTVALSSVITTTALGELADKTTDAILGGAVVKNPSLVISECEVADITDTSANIKAKSGSTKYTGVVAVSFTLASSKFNIKIEEQAKKIDELQALLKEQKK